MDQKVSTTLSHAVSFVISQYPKSCHHLLSNNIAYLPQVASVTCSQDILIYFLRPYFFFVIIQNNT